MYFSEWPWRTDLTVAVRIRVKVLVIMHACIICDLGLHAVHTVLDKPLQISRQKTWSPFK